MQQRPASEAEILFDRLAADLVVIRPDLINVVLCPLCLRAFERSTFGQEDGLTVEHIIPGAIGGTDKTLTCKECNNTHGSSLDAHLVRMLRAQDWIVGNESTMKGKILFDGIELPMELTWGGTDKGKLIKILGGNPGVLESFKEGMSKAQSGGKFNLRFSLDYKEANARRAFVRIGYLALFQHLGYSYVLSPAAVYVRKLIAGEGTEHLGRLLLQLEDVEEPEGMPALLVFPFGTERAIVAYMVSIRIDSPQTLRRGVLLPSAIVPEESVLRVLFEVGPHIVEKRMTMNVSIPTRQESTRPPIK
jgi:hypothetical protein